MTRPPDTRITPTSPLRRVLLPEPFGPMTDTTSPGATRTETSRMIGSPPYPAVTPSARSNGPGRAVPAGGPAIAGRGACSADKVCLDDIGPLAQLGHG